MNKPLVFLFLTLAMSSTVASANSALEDELYASCMKSAREEGRGKNEEGKSFCRCQAQELLHNKDVQNVFVEMGEEYKRKYFDNHTKKWHAGASLEDGKHYEGEEATDIAIGMIIGWECIQKLGLISQGSKQ